MTPERVTVLATEAIPSGEVSKAEGERRMAAAEADYDAADKADVTSLDVAMDKIQSARAMVDAAA